MGTLGMSELVIILLIVIVIFGASRLPQLGKGLGEGIRNFKSSLKTGQDESAKSEAASKIESSQES
jgi:sec-independent protein translocase protein TatA